MEIKTKYIPLLLIIAFSLKALFIGITWELAAVLFVLGSVLVLLENKVENKNLELLKQELKELRSQITIKEAKEQEKSKELDDIKTAMSAIKLANGFRMQQVK
jgi:hypothetical protein